MFNVLKPSNVSGYRVVVGSCVLVPAVKFPMALNVIFVFYSCALLVE